MEKEGTVQLTTACISATNITETQLELKCQHLHLATIRTSSLPEMQSKTLVNAHLDAFGTSGILIKMSSSC